MRKMIRKAGAVACTFTLLFGMVACGKGEKQTEEQTTPPAVTTTATPEATPEPTPEPTATPKPAATATPAPEPTRAPIQFEASMIPPVYKQKLPEEHRGTVELIEYKSKAYHTEEKAETTKKANVYLPAGYDESRQYDIVFLMHGIGGSESNNEWKIQQDSSQIRNILDNLIYYGAIKPVIVVTPNGKTGGGNDSYYTFGQELRNELIPYMDSHYATYGEYDENGYDLTAAREHRAMAGFSMGGMQTINIGLCECLDIIAYTGAFAAAPTSNSADVIAQKLATFSEEYPVGYFYSICGTEDSTAYWSAKAASAGLADKTDRLEDGVNFTWHEMSGGHSGGYVGALGFYNFLQFAFPEPTLESLYLKDFALENGFTLGTVMNYSQLSSTYYVPMVESEFQSITAANEMKAYSLLDQPGSQNNPDGMPVMNYSQADAIVSFAQENGIGVRGHVLVWDAYMSDWFFREGYNSDGAYVDQATMKARLKYYIEEVVTHFETEFPGVVYCWDVVNEAVGDGGDYKSDDPRHVRTYRNSDENMFYTIIGADYVEFSFACAKETVEKLQAANPDVSIELFYNDYSTFYDAKRDAIIELVKSINSYEKNDDGTYKKLCDGIGMQSYIGGYGQQAGCMNTQDITRIEKAIRMFHDLGVKVHVTEMAVRNYDQNKMEQHAEFYGKLFEAYEKLNEEGDLIQNISIWGICDDPMMSKSDYSYKQNGPYCGLFNRGCKRKDAYYEALKALKD